MKPIVDGLIEQYKGKVNISYMDVDKEEYSDEVQAFKINAVPTFIFFSKNGKQVDKHIGAISKAQLEQKINNLQN